MAWSQNSLTVVVGMVNQSAYYVHVFLLSLLSHVVVVAVVVGGVVAVSWLLIVLATCWCISRTTEPVGRVFCLEARRPPPPPPPPEVARARHTIIWTGQDYPTGNSSGGGRRRGRQRKRWVCLFVGCLTSQQQASVSQGRICSDNFTCCHT